MSILAVGSVVKPVHPCCEVLTICNRSKVADIYASSVNTSSAITSAVGNRLIVAHVVNVNLAVYLAMCLDVSESVSLVNLALVPLYSVASLLVKSTSPDNAEVG